MKSKIYQNDRFGIRGYTYDTSLIIEEFKALKKGETSYCFSLKQVNEIRELCEKNNVKFTYFKDEDGIFTLTPISCES